MAKQPKKIGRPTKRTDEIIQRILDGLRAGTPLTIICQPEDMPADRTVREWMASDDQLSADIACAREVGFDAIATEALEIIDQPPERVVTLIGEDRSESRIDSASVQWAFRRAELRLKLLAKWDPKRYGERLALAGDKDAPLHLTVSGEDAEL